MYFFVWCPYSFNRPWFFYSKTILILYFFLLRLSPFQYLTCYVLPSQIFPFELWAWSILKLSKLLRVSPSDSDLLPIFWQRRTFIDVTSCIPNIFFVPAVPPPSSFRMPTRSSAPTRNSSDNLQYEVEGSSGTANVEEPTYRVEEEHVVSEVLMKEAQQIEMGTIQEEEDVEEEKGRRCKRRERRRRQRRLWCRSRVGWVVRRDISITHQTSCIATSKAQSSQLPNKPHNQTQLH